MRFETNVSCFQREAGPEMEKSYLEKVACSSLQPSAFTRSIALNFEMLIPIYIFIFLFFFSYFFAYHPYDEGRGDEEGKEGKRHVILDLVNR